MSVNMSNIARVSVHSRVDWRLSHVEVRASLLAFHNNELTNTALCTSRSKYTVTEFNYKHSVASPGFVARRVKAANLVMGDLRRTSGLGAAAARWLNSFVTNAVLIERAASCWHLHQLISQTTQYLDSWLSYLLRSELKMKLLEVEGEGARAPVPHSWRRHCKHLFYESVKVLFCYVTRSYAFSVRWPLQASS